MGKQLQFYLTEEQARRLYEIASRQCRRPHEHARFIILNALGLAEEDQPLSHTRANNDTGAIRQDSRAAIVSTP